VVTRRACTLVVGKRRLVVEKRRLRVARYRRLPEVSRRRIPVLPPWRQVERQHRR
jgi:hypothetical protein